MTTNHFNGLTEAELERLSILIEECSEVIQICGKILRHGYESYNPNDTKKTTNRKLLAKELGDVKCSVKMLTKNNIDIKHEDITKFNILKEAKISRYLHHN